MHLRLHVTHTVNTPVPIVLVAALTACSTLLGANDPIEVTDAGPGALPTGVRILAGSSLRLPQPAVLGSAAVLPRYTTADGYVPYLDGSDGVLKVIQLAPGSTPTPVAPFGAGTRAYATNRTLLLAFPSKTVITALAGPLFSFSEPSGAIQLSPTAYLAGPSTAVSADGQRIAEWEFDPVLESASLVVTNVDGSGRVTLVPSSLVGSGCVFPVAFAGTQDDTVVASWCTTLLSSPVLASFSVSGSTVTQTATIQKTGGAFITDGAGRFAATSTGGVTGNLDDPAGVAVLDISSGKVPLIDPEPTVAALGFFTGSSTDETVSFLTPTGYWVSPIATPSPTKLESGSFSTASLFGLSPGGGSALVSVAGTSLSTFDLTLVSTAEPFRSTPLVSGPTGNVLGDCWTVDSSHVLWGDPVTTSPNGVMSGTLHALAVGDTTPATVGQGVHLAWATASSKIIAVANVFSIGGGLRGDLIAYDLSTTPPSSRLLVSNVDADFTLTADRTQIVYTYSGDTDPQSPYDGLWVMGAP